MTLWTYWEGPRSPLIDLCLETLAKFHTELRILGPSDIAQLGGGDVLTVTEGMSLAYRSDLVRWWLLRQFGGLWVDADTIALQRIDLLDLAEEAELVGIYNPHLERGWGSRGLLATPVGGCPQSPLLQQAFERCWALLEQQRSGNPIRYGHTSTGVASEVFHSARGKNRTVRRQHWRYCRVPWTKARQVFLATGPAHRHERSPYWTPAACCYHLTNPIPAALGERSREELLRGKMFAEFLIEKALGRVPSIFGRTREILRRIEHLKLPKVAEVGVFRGMNARHLLQQHRRVRLTLVDRWSQSHDESYRRSGDFQARLSPAQWQSVYRAAQQNVAFAKDRVTMVRRGSIDAAERMADASFDLVFIDADHSYEGCLADIRAWFPKVKPGGWIGGHDYGHRREGRLYGVKRAVDEAFAGQRVETGEDGCWWVCPDPAALERSPSSVVTSPLVGV